MEKSKCSICGTEESKGWLGKGMWTLCKRCSKDISDFELQPNKHFNTEILAEVFFRRGQGEAISYEELHKEKSSMKFITFEDLFKMERLNTTTKK